MRVLPNQARFFATLQLARTNFANFLRWSLLSVAQFTFARAGISARIAVTGSSISGTNTTAQKLTEPRQRRKYLPSFLAS